MVNFNFFSKFKNNSLKGIKIIVWDVDGTLWRNSDLGITIKNEYVNFLNDNLKKPKTKVRTLFENETEKHSSWSATASFLSGIAETNIISAVEPRVNRSLYIIKDLKLMATFRKMSEFRHIILTNNTYKSVITTLKLLGFPFTGFNKVGLEYPPFEKIFAVEQTKNVKPNIKAFLKVLQYTKLTPQEHLLVGDMLDVDIKPAKKLKIKTCLVWQKNTVADYCLSDVYKIPSIIKS
jgi:FMN phosphatase YigB (HAD superfamily)